MDNFKDKHFLNVADSLESSWPSFLPQPSDPVLLEKVWVQPFEIITDPITLKAKATFFFEEEISLNIPGIDAVSILLAQAYSGTLISLEVQIKPELQVKLIEVPIAIRLKQDLLKPVKESTTSDGTKEYVVDDSKSYLDIALGKVGFTISSEGGISFQLTTAVDLPKCMIGDTGVVIEAKDMKFHFDESAPPPGQPAGWKGLYFASLSMYLPKDLATTVGSLSLTDCYIGNGGFSGKITNTWLPPLNASLFGMAVTLNSVSIALVQNVFTRASLTGAFKLPFFEEMVNIDIGFGLDGFTVALSGAGGLFKLEKAGLLSIEISSMGFEDKDGILIVSISGKLKPLFGGLDWPTFDVRKISIDANGHVQLEGGWLDLPDHYSLNFFGFQLEIKHIGLGKNDDSSKWIGFSGALRLIDGLQAGASVDGLRISWQDGASGPTDLSISFNGIGVEFEVPAVFRFKGAISYRELPGNVHRFDGAIKLELITLNLEIDAQLVIGTADAPGEGAYTFMAIYLGVDLPVGIPLWTTGLALYGIEGLFALQMEPDKHTDEPWYGMADGEGWYKRPAIGVTDLLKWTNRQDSFALGAGITIGTFPDNGFSFSGRMLLAIIFPGPIILIEGKGNILKARSSLRGDPLFRALMVMDAREGTITIGLDAQYKFAEGGELLDIQGSVEAFFSFVDPMAWHLYIGMKDPEEKRIRAKVLSLFEASAYFMLDAHSLAYGGWVGYNGHWSFGPLRVTFEAWIDHNMKLSYSPAHVYGDLWAHGKVALTVFGFGLGLSIDARIEGEVYDPFHLLGEFEVGISLPWPLPDFSADVSLEWGPEPTPPGYSATTEGSGNRTF